MKKRLTSWLLTLAMLLSLVPAMGVTASAAEPEWTPVSTYKELYDAVDKGDAKVKLVANIDTTNDNGGAGVTNQTALVFFGNNNILDLNGHTLKLVSNTGTTFIYVNKNLTIKDSGTSGRINFEYGPNVMHRTTAIYVSHASNEDIAHLTVESGTLSSTKGGITLIESIGNLTINGGKFYAPYVEGSGGTYAIHTIHQYNDNAKTIINGGEIDGVVFIQRDDSAATGTPNYGDIPVQINGGTFKQAVQLRWTEKGKPSGNPTEFSPAVEIAGGIFEKRVNKTENNIWGEDLSTKLTGGTFKDFPNSFGLGRGGKSDHEYYSKSLGNSIIVRGNEIRTSCDWSEADWFKIYFDVIHFDGSESTPVTVIPNAWGMKSVTLDGTTPINYAKDWKGTVERMDNSTAHTLKFEWYPLASELVNAGYSYDAKCEHYISGSTAVQQTDTIAADKTSHTVTIPAGADPKVYSYDLQLNLQKDGSNIGIFTNDHIVKLVVNPAPVVTEITSAPVRLSAALTPGNSFPNAAAVGSGYTVDSINWYTNSACNNPASTFAARTDYFGKIVLKPEKNYKFAASTSAVPFCDDPNENYSIVGSAAVEADGSSLTLIVRGTTVSALVWDSVDTNNQTYTIGDSALTLHAKATGGDNSKPITYKLIAEKDGTETVKASATVAETKDFSASLRFTDKGSYACWFEATRGNVTITSEAFTVTVNAPGLSIENQSGDLTVKQNATARLFVKAKGYGVNYQWQVKNDDDSWNDISSETAYDYAAPTKEVGAKTYRCMVTDKYGATEYTNEMTVTVTEGTDPNLTPAIPLAAVNGDAPDPAKLWKDKKVPASAWLGLEAKYDVTAGDTFNGVATFSTIPTGFTVNDRDIYYDSYNKIQKTPVLGTISYEWKGTKVPFASATSGDFTTLGTDAHASFQIPSDVNTYYVKLSVKNKIDDGAPQESTVNITFHVSAAHTHTYAYAQLDATNHTKYCTAGDYSDTETHTPDGNMCKYCGYAPANNSYSVNVTNGSATPTTDVAPGTKVTLTANAAPTGQEFDKWVGNVNVTGNTFNMPSHHVTVAATYKPITHTHDTDSQKWTSFNDDVHSRSCSAGDDVQFADHKFNSWTDNGDGTHTGTCTECGYVKTEMIPATGGGSSSGGGGGGGVGTSAYAITVNSAKNGGVTASHKSTSKGTTVTLTVAPDKGYVLDTLTVLDGKDKEIKLTEKSGKFTFTMPDSKVTVAAAFKASAPTGKNPFTDVPAGSYYEDAVIWAVDKGITGGTSATTFSPDATCTRAQIVTFLWRAAGSPEPKAMSTFVDVSADAYYAKAVAWAVENGITGGTGDGKFSPDAACTRAQAVTFLWRANGSPAVSGNAAFSDVAANAYYAAAVTWAEKNGITGGIGGGLFGSDHNCTRAQIVTFLYSSMK